MGTYFSLLLQPSYVSQPFTGHASHVMSLDFSPKNNEILCSCDANSEIRFWNINQYSCTRAFKASFGAFSLSVVLFKYLKIYWI